MSKTMDTFFSPPPTNLSISRPTINNRFSPKNYKFQGPKPLNMQRSSLDGPPRYSANENIHVIGNDNTKNVSKKSVFRKTVDYNSSLIRMLQSRIWQRDFRDRPFLQPIELYTPHLLPPQCYINNCASSITTTLVKTVTNRLRSPVICSEWTPEGRRLITGTYNGELTVWNGLTYNFETIIQAHNSAVLSMTWSHNGNWMITGDNKGFVKYWQSNINSVNMFQAHKEAVISTSFSPPDNKFATCSYDGTIRIWDFFTNREEKILQIGARVKCIDWHPQKGLLISGSKDYKQSIKLWDPKTGQSLVTLNAHKSTVMDVKWNANGNWLVSASSDSLLKLFDIRNLSRTVQTFKGHKNKVNTIAWHPFHENLFCSGGDFNASILFWNVDVDKCVGSIENAHGNIISSLAWHPIGIVLCSSSYDTNCKFWTRNRPGKKEVKSVSRKTENTTSDAQLPIPGLGFEGIDKKDFHKSLVDSTTSDIASTNGVFKDKKIFKSKQIPKNFQNLWYEYKANDQIIEINSKKNIGPDSNLVNKSSMDLIPDYIPARNLKPEFPFVYGQMIKIDRNQPLENGIRKDQESLMHSLNSDVIPKVRQHRPFESNNNTISAYADQHFQNDQIVRRNAFNNDVNANIFTRQDVDLRINYNFNQNNVYSNNTKYF
ncbi:WD40/YVTN repeat-like-containing domain,WD40-repeat-containing domain,WD40 repeat,WD40 repeat [Cinara cedri]|uniref:WD40/YVTN repeat-like-containing domain,WD40-repeat-containing domain,WD40 repeat,WD40 repeat n=1 Tax=Cinara cedri TaxID=506608 RepID=A0A5E4NIS3_9HEMI|nr:WD40/YVTN repeat-like-containing domain,WD40-repeat-containing domain,WD40 repeat,WD40 repeat [Cinara cedri]